MNIFARELSERDRQTIGECLSAAAQKEFFPEWEFETLFGISRRQLFAVRDKWPNVDADEENVSAAVIGALNHLLGYPHMQDARWNKHISVGPDAIRLILDKLLSLGL